MNRNHLLKGATWLLLATPAVADGSEALGTASIPIAATGEITLAGVGLVDAQPASFSVDLPAGAVVAQVLAYWDGLDFPESVQGETDVIRLNGVDVTGQRIGGATNFYDDYFISGYRADVTGLNLVGAGTSQVQVEGLDFTYADNGLALVIITEDEARSIAVVDGLDYAYRNFGEPFRTAEPVTYTFEPSEVERLATVDLLVGGVSSERPSVVEIWVDGVLVREEIDLLTGSLGPEFDAHSLDFVVPAGASEVRVEVISEDRGGVFAGNLEASLTWIFSGLNLDLEVEDTIPYGCSPHWWLCNWWRWDPWCTGDNVVAFDFEDRFNETFGVSCWDSGLWDHKTLGHGIVGAGPWWHFWLRMLNREAVAALLNAGADIGYPYSVDEVISLYRDAVGAEPGAGTICSVLVQLYEANRLGCPPLW